MTNRKFLDKAEQLKQPLIETVLTCEGSDRVLKDGDEIVFDMGKHCVGYTEIRLSSVGHHPDAPLLMSVQFAEIAKELEQDTGSYQGWISPSWIQEERVHVDVIPGTVSFSRRYSFRYIKIRVINVSDNYSVRVDGIRVKTVSSADRTKLIPSGLSGKDKLLDDISVNTLHACMQEVFEDGPKRDRRMWLGDLRLEALADYVTFRNTDLVKRCLYLFAGTTLEEGRLANNLFLYPEVECDFQTMFDYTLFYINTLWDYYRETGDRETLEELEPVCVRQYELLRDCFDKNGLIDLNKAGNIFVDWNFDLDKTACGQAIYVYALKDLLKMERELGEETGELEAEIRNKEEAAQTMYDPGKGLYVSGEKKQVSVASQMWMVLAGIASGDRAGEILMNVLEESEAVALNSPYAYHFLIQALLDAGLKDEAYQRMVSYWGAMADQGADTFWEIFNPEDPYFSPYGGIVVHSFCHAWSCTPAYFLRKYYSQEQ
ncbi:MAG: hypothetical protein IKF39_12560 [Oscillospiraceae bacterium]|nr:hypothetical protein [Oscillospiraceae bacterium]